MRAIDVDALEQDIRKNFEKYAYSVVFEDKFIAMRFKQIEQYIKTFPVVEAEPVKRGRWARDIAGVTKCSVCNHQAYHDVHGYELFDYCPFCGAKMECEE